MHSSSPPSTRVFSGIQPTGKLHLGNYLGAIRNWAKLQDGHDCIFCIVDLHAITVWQDPAELTASTREVTAAVIAGGIDPERSILFNQSQVPGHAQLAWILNCVARLGWLNRMTQFKEKAGKDRENASVGLYTYPNLMAADILLYKTTHVPVGEDQKQHLELCRDIAQKFNRDFGVDLFPLPEPLIQGPAKRVMSLRDGAKKMSKSDPSDYSRLNLIDDADTIAAKLRKARTDPHLLPNTVEGLADRPEALNLLQVYAGLADLELPAAVERFAGQPFSKFKEELIALAVDELAPIAAETRRLMADPHRLDEILRDGTARANQLAQPVLDEVFAVVGFVGRGRSRD